LGYAISDRVRAIRRTKVYDLCAAAPFIAWCLFGVMQSLFVTAQDIALIKIFLETDVSILPASLVLRAVSRICTVTFLAVMAIMFAVRTPPKMYARGVYPRFVALAGTWVSVGIVQLPPQQIPSGAFFLSVFLLIAGTILATLSAVALARSISIMPEARRLVTRGPYLFVRHPLYLGEMTATTGLAIQYLMPWAMLMLGLHCIFQFERMESEERVLSEAFPEYKHYMAKTARLIPGIY
jgi:protein-S-isoprenylcysteine O-methyltransferase Ste14